MGPEVHEAEKPQKLFCQHFLRQRKWDITAVLETRLDDEEYKGLTDYAFVTEPERAGNASVGVALHIKQNKTDLRWSSHCVRILARCR